MRKVNHILLSLFSLLMVVGVTYSCGISDPDDPAHPLYASYAMTADFVSYDGPEQLRADIQTWIKNNSIYFDREVSYSTGDASEFATTDAEAIQRYEQEFLPKFQAYLEEVKNKVLGGTYGKGAHVQATMFTSAVRVQGKDGTLRYQQHELSY